MRQPRELLREELRRVAEARETRGVGTDRPRFFSGDRLDEFQRLKDEAETFRRAAAHREEVLRNEFDPEFSSESTGMRDEWEPGTLRQKAREILRDEIENDIQDERDMREGRRQERREGRVSRREERRDERREERVSRRGERRDERREDRETRREDFVRGYVEDLGRRVSDRISGLYDRFNERLSSRNQDWD